MPGFTPDSTCIVAALSAWHQDHEACATEIEQRLARGEPLRIAAPMLVESYSVLTRLPRPRRVSPIVALSLLRDTLMQRGSVIALDQGSYTDLLDRAVTQGTAGGQIYDAVVAACARLAGVRTLLTLNERHFRPFAGDGLMIEVPHSDHGWASHEMGSQVVPRMSESTMRQLVRLVRELIDDVIAWGGRPLPDLTTALALLAVVLTVSALASGLVQRAPISFPMIFLGFGAVAGERGLGLIVAGPHDPALEAVAVVCLSLVLFIDAVQFRLDELRTGWQVPVLTTGPGTLITIGLIAAAAMLLLGEALAPALLLGAALASLDPVVVRDVVRDMRIPGPIRRALSLEGGTNDLVVLPVILILIAVSDGSVGGTGGWLLFLTQLFLLGPLAGLAVGVAGSWAIGAVDRRTPVPREYQALYGIGLVFAAYVAGEVVGGSGFLAAFVAGFSIVLSNRELCDCFVEFGEVAGEMAMLLAFILLGAALSTVIDSVALGSALLFAAFVLGVARPAAILFVLRRATVSRPARLFIAGFGPRGLSSLLLVLLMLRDGVEGAERLFALAGVVVVASVIVHGAAAAPLGAWYGRRLAVAPLDEERESTVAGLFRGPATDAPRITPAQLAALLAGPEPPLVLDVRTRSQYARDEGRIPGSVRVLPDQVAEWAAGADPARPVVAYCTWPDEATSARVARQLRSRGFDASALLGGFAAWAAEYPVEPMPRVA